MTSQLFILDAGNSRIKLGLFNFDSSSRLPTCQALSSLELQPQQDLETLHNWVSRFVKEHAAPDSAGILSGSNLTAIQQLEMAWPHTTCPLVTKQNRDDFPIPIKVDFPEKVGMDRLLNSLAVREIKPPDHLGVIVDTGTATTVDVIDQHGCFQGGAILPGLRLSALALHHYTSQLPLVDVNQLTKIPLRPIGKNTQEAILNGILWGHLGAIHELVTRYSDTAGAPVSCYITGGAAPLLLPHLKLNFEHYPYLPLQGLAIWHRISPSLDS